MQVKIDWNGGKITKAMQEAAIRAASDAAEFILQESNKIVPHDEGTLERSGNTDMGIQEGKPSATVYYDTPYAARLHEHPEYNFQNGREGKYLEKTLNKNMIEIGTYMANKIKDLLRGG
jgi:hypothetical protein